VRRNNAPIRPRKPATSIPDLLFALAASGWTMAAVFVAASFVNNDVTAGDAGRILARMFAAALAVAAAFTCLLAVLLLRDDRNRADHIIFPMVVGVAIGLLFALLFLGLHFYALFAPFLLLVLVFRPVRRRLFGRNAPARR
jgi:CHASE2 domain-containing sensor protein